MRFEKNNLFRAHEKTSTDQHNMHRKTSTPTRGAQNSHTTHISRGSKTIRAPQRHEMSSDAG